MADNLDDLRHKVAQSCRILAMIGSVRIPGADELFIRCPDIAPV